MSREPKPLGEGVDRLLRDLGAPSAGTIDRLHERWADVVGPVLAEHTRPVVAEGGRLVVEADDPAVASRVRWSTRALLEALDAVVGPGAIGGLEVRVRPPDRGSGGPEGQPG